MQTIATIVIENGAGGELIANQKEQAAAISTVLCEGREMMIGTSGFHASASRRS
jgi:hypothetical protein